MEVGYKKFRSMFIKSAYFGLFQDWKIKSKFAITPEDKLHENTNFLKNNSILNTYAMQNPNKSSNENVINKKCKEQQRLPCVNLKLSIPQLHKIEPKLNLENTSKESKKL